MAKKVCKVLNQFQYNYLRNQFIDLQNQLFAFSKSTGNKTFEQGAMSLNTTYDKIMKDIKIWNKDKLTDEEFMTLHN